MSESESVRATVKIFRAADAPDIATSECMKMEAMTELQRAGLKKAVAAGYLEGDEVKILVDMPGFSIAYAWLKKDYPLMRHSHNSDCMYYVIAGSLKMGTETLGPRDSFFVPADAPYTYTPGADGVEVLEFRHNPSFNFVNLSHNESWWDKAEKICEENRDEWKKAVRPSQK